MNWFRKRIVPAEHFPEISTSILYDEGSFYNKFLQDTQNAQKEVIIESPFISTRRLNTLKPLFEHLIAQNIDVYVMTRSPQEHDETMAKQAEGGIRYFERLGVQVLLCTGNHHRKLAMIDRRILWEGSLNILSQTQSREIMRRIDSKRLTLQMFTFLKFDQASWIRSQPELI